MFANNSSLFKEAWATLSYFPGTFLQQPQLGPCLQSPLCYNCGKAGLALAPGWPCLSQLGSTHRRLPETLKLSQKAWSSVLMLLVAMGLMFTLNWSQTANSGWKSGYHFCRRMLMWINGGASWIVSPSSTSQQIAQWWLLAQEYKKKSKRTLDRDATQHDPEKNVILVLLNGDHVPISIHDKSAPACHYQPCNFQDLLFIWGLFSSFLKCTLCTQTQIN